MVQIGVLKERKTDENRVALTPEQVQILTQKRHIVHVENGCGENSGYHDDDYGAAGAVVTSKTKLMEQCPLIVKVKAPLPDEFGDYRPDHTLFCYLHFDENIEREKIAALISTGLLGIAFEWVEKDGRYPLLEPMSRLTGYLFGMKACELLARHKGILPGRHEPMLAGAHVLILGGGVIGVSAIKYFMDLKAHITVLDKNPGSLNRRINERLGTDELTDHVAAAGIRLVRFDNEDPFGSRGQLEQLMPETDILLCCALRRPDLPKSKLDYLVTAGMVAKMKPGSVVCDATACVRDMIETAVPHEEIDHHYLEQGVLHYNCDHIPSMVGRTATKVLSDATFPYLLELAEKGPLRAIRENRALQKGVSCYRNFVTLKVAAEKKSLPYKDIMELL